jgi:hypothetical protein
MPVRRRRRGRSNFQRHPPEDIVVQAVVLAYIVAECPEGVMIPTLALRFNAEFDQGYGGSAVERAVRELVCDGRLRMQGGRVIPDRAAWSVARYESQ